jgi:hypothetical protein
MMLDFESNASVLLTMISQMLCFSMLHEPHQKSGPKNAHCTALYVTSFCQEEKAHREIATTG